MKIFVRYMNYENRKMLVCKTFIMKMWCFQYINNTNRKTFVWDKWIMKKLNISLQYMNYTKMYNMNYENRKLFVNTLIMKMFVSDTWIMKTV